MTDRTAVIWHDLECGAYMADLPLWRELADAERGAVLDVGAGTGRVTLDLARAGHRVVALDREQAFLDTLRARAGALTVETVVADAGGFALPGREFALILAPMQTIQLLGPEGRAGFLRSAREHLARDGLVACALALEMDPWTHPPEVPPWPDERVVDGLTYTSQPVALRDVGDRMRIERVRATTYADGGSSALDDVIHLDKVDVARVEAQAQAAGLTPCATRVIPPTEHHIGTTVVMLRG
jgi:SAM-dependent methyltransferase